MLLNGPAQSLAPVRTEGNSTQRVWQTLFDARQHQNVMLSLSEPSVGPAHVRDQRLPFDAFAAASFPIPCGFFFCFFVRFFLPGFSLFCPVFSCFLPVFYFSFLVPFFFYVSFLFSPFVFLLFIVHYIKSSPRITKIFIILRKCSSYIMKQCTLHSKIVHCVLQKCSQYIMKLFNVH